ncbi:hypothetical protein P7K49_035425, partial [Saguinus oedipus]
PRATRRSPGHPSAMNQIEPGVQYNYVYDEDEYMIQEEEWDRDLLLDPAWEKQQRKVSRGPRAARAWWGPVPPRGSRGARRGDAVLSASSQSRGPLEERGHH